MVYNEDLDDEIRRVESRLYYLRTRKRTGKPIGSTGTYTSRTKVKRPRKKEEELHVFYRTHIIDGSFKKEYDNLRENMIKHSKAFACYHNQVFNAIRKYGNAKMMEDFDNMCHIDNIDIKL